MIRRLSSIYGAAAAWRRQWYTSSPSRRSRLARPVISVGNLTVGGSGKTPVVGHIARLLAESGERPAILSRGYGRRNNWEAVTVVSDGAVVRADVESAGDEPLMLARALPGVVVVVGASRYRAGRVAEERLGATVHLLDDGFQHVQLERTLDLLLLSENDLSEPLLPMGRLREPLAAAAVADAALVSAGYASAVARIARAIGVPTAFQVTRSLGAPRRIGPASDTVVVPSQARVFAVAAIARPERFFSDVATAGWDLVGSLGFGDHHWFSPGDVARIRREAKAASAAIVLTTAKDAVRLELCDLGNLSIAAVPILTGIEPADEFLAWLLAGIGHPPLAADPEAAKA